MTATEELRRLLDERKVEWSKGAYPNEARTYWMDMVARPWNEKRLYVMALLTPEQAVKATLGRGACRIVGGKCDQCGAIVREKAVTYWVPTGDGIKTARHHDARYCPNCGAKVVEE